MDLATKFKMVAACQQTKITSLKIDTPYPIERAERVVTKYGEAILVTLQATDTFLKVFLPRRYGTLFSDEDLRSITIKLSQPKIPRHQPHHKFLHLRVGIVILVKRFPDGVFTPTTHNEAEQQQP